MAQLPGGISLKCYNGATGLLRYDYSLEQDLKLVTKSEYNCGYSEATFELCDYYNKLPHIGDKIIVKDDSRNEIAWLGEFASLRKDVGVKASVSCLGYGKTSAFDLPYAHGNLVIPGNPSSGTNPDGSKQVYRAGSLLSDMILDTLTRTQNIVQGTITDLSGFQLAEDTKDYIGLAPAQIWNEAMLLVAGLVTPLAWFVFEDIAQSGLASLFVRFVEQTARLRCTWDNRLVKVLGDAYERDQFINGCTVAYGSGLQYNYPDDASILRDHSILPTNHDRDKFVNANNAVRTTSKAQQLAESYVARFVGPLQASRANVEICGGQVTAIPPLVPTTQVIPSYLIKAGYVIDVQNMPAGDAPYNWQYKFIMSTSHDWASGKTSLDTAGTGMTSGQGQDVAIIETYLTSRPYQASQSGQPSQPYVDQDTTNSYGAPATGLNQFSGGVRQQNTVINGVPKFIENSSLGGTDGGSLTDPNKPKAPYDALVDPNIIPDYGIMGNYEADGAAGIKGLIQVIPGRIAAWHLYVLPNPSDVSVPDESITVELYTDYPTLAQPMGRDAAHAQVSIAAAKEASGTFTDAYDLTYAHLYQFTQAGTIGIKVITPMGDVTRGFHLTLYGPKQYPDLGVKP